jgi:MFS family permease
MPVTPPAGPASAPAGYSRAELAAIFTSALLGYAMDGYNLLILSFLMPYIVKTTGISPVESGLVFSMQLIASILGGALFGWVADAIGRRNGLMLTIGLYSVGALLSGVAWNFGSLLALRFVTGLGLGGEWGLGMALFNEAWSRRRRGLGSSVIQSSFLVGVFVAGVVAARLIAALGPSAWRLTLMTGFVPVLLVAVIRFWMPDSRLWEQYDRLRRRGGLPEEKRRESAPLVEIFRGRTLLLTVTGLLLVGGFMLAFYAVTSFVPTLIIRTYHGGPATFEAVNTAVVWISIPFYVLFGWLSDGWGRKRAFLVPAGVLLAGSILLYLASVRVGAYPGSIWRWPFFWAYLVWYVGTAAAALFGVWLSEVFPVEMRATAVSVTYMLGRGASAISPVLVPLIAAGTLFSARAATGQSMALLSCVGVVVMVIFGLVLPETRGRVFRVIERPAGSLAQEELSYDP